MAGVHALDVAVQRWRRVSGSRTEAAVNHSRLRFDSAAMGLLINRSCSIDRQVTFAISTATISLVHFLDYQWGISVIHSDR
jgi:hypothetical protein